MNLKDNRHMWLMLLCCLIPIAALGAIFLFNVQVSSVVYAGIILLCPVLHLFMMKGMMGDHGHGEKTSQEVAPTLAKDS